MKKNIKYWLLMVCVGLVACVSEKKVEGVKEKQIRAVPQVESTCPDVNCFKNKMLQKGIATQTDLDYFFNSVKYKDNIIRVMNKPGTSNPWYVFKKNNVSPTTIKQGINFYKRNKAVLDSVALRTGVAPEYIVAILGIETRFGAIMGHDRVADALYTLAFHYPRRATLFQKELEEFLVMSKEANRDPFTYQGSFAGAMGYPQFMPSSYRQWAVSYSGTSFPDVWNKETDAIASIANYFKGHGWIKGQAVVYPVSLYINPELQAIIDEKTSLRYSVKDLKSRGVNFFNQLPEQTKVILFRLETSPGVYSYFVGLNNFYTIWQYNNSRMYVMAVEEIAKVIREGIR